MTTTIPLGTENSKQVVDLPGGLVTLEPLDQLTTSRDQIASQRADVEARANQLTQNAIVKERLAGAILVAQRGTWATAEFSDLLAKCDQLTAQIDAIDAQLAELSNVARHGLSGFFKRFGDRKRHTTLVMQRDQLAALVAAALQTLAEHTTQSTVPEADELLIPARRQLAEASQLRQQQQTQQAEVDILTNEIDRRRESIKQLGFDALWTAAWLQSNDPAVVDSPLTLKRGEVAWVSVSSDLSRQATRTQWTGSSQGFSFPIGHTGIRYRVGSFRGHPIQSTFIKYLDSGSLVLTNQRLVFVGRMKSVTIGLAHIVHVEAYTDSLGVFQDKRETPDFFKLQSPQYVLFYLNYALGRLTQPI